MGKIGNDLRNRNYRVVGVGMKMYLLTCVGQFLCHKKSVLTFSKRIYSSLESLRNDEIKCGVKILVKNNFTIKKIINLKITLHKVTH